MERCYLRRFIEMWLGQREPRGTLKVPRGSTEEARGVLEEVGIARDLPWCGTEATARTVVLKCREAGEK